MLRVQFTKYIFILYMSFFHFQVTLFLELADAYRISGQNQEATRTMQEAISEFQGTPEEIR